VKFCCVEECIFSYAVIYLSIPENICNVKTNSRITATGAIASLDRSNADAIGFPGTSDAGAMYRLEGVGVAPRRCTTVSPLPAILVGGDAIGHFDRSNAGAIGFI